MDKLSFKTSNLQCFKKWIFKCWFLVTRQKETLIILSFNKCMTHFPVLEIQKNKLFYMCQISFTYCKLVMKVP